MLMQFISTIRDKYLDFDFSDEQRKGVLILFAGFLAVGGIFFALSQGQASEPVIDLVPVVVAPVIPEVVIVDVSGRVKSPGVYSLAKGSRAIDALNLAGGAKPGVDLSDLNLAHILFDGEQIIVGAPKVNYSFGTKSKVKIKTPTVSSPLNLNIATQLQLETLPGIGPVMAARIIAYKLKNGPFALIEDLKKVTGIGESKFAEISKLVRI